MSQTKQVNRQFLLGSRPVGAPVRGDFNLVETAISAIKPGEVLLRSVYLSLDPYMRGRMSDAKSYAPPVAVGEPMVGGAVCRIEQSLNSDFAVGDWVVAFAGWQNYAVSDGQSLLKIDASLTHRSYALGVLGMPGLTAYMGLLDIGQPQAGETVVVAGAVGSLVGQIAKLKGCKVVGIAGGAEKCLYAVE
jgi:NADPH-dependent curcumin reductase CurA